MSHLRGQPTSSLKVEKIEVPDPEYMSEIPESMKNNDFPGFPSTTLVCGPPGRGKTNLVMWMLLTPGVWNKFFDKIYAYGPTVKSDKLYKRIKLQPDNVVTEVKKIIPDLEKKLAEQTKLVEANPNTAPKVLFLFEDMTSFFNTVQSKPEFHRCYTQCRHVKGASITMVHKYHAFNRTPRTSSQHIICFKMNQKDIVHLYEEFGPVHMNVKEFALMVNHALVPDPENPKPFFYINTMVEDRIQYRRNFTQVYEINPNALSKNMSSKRTRESAKTSFSEKKQKKDDDDGIGLHPFQ